MKQFSRQKIPYKKPAIKTHNSNGLKRVNWWTPLWQGLVSDKNAKHRKTMGSSIWLYLYLLTYTNRKTGIVRRTLLNIKSDTGSLNRTTRRDLKRLSEKGYINILESRPQLTIRIEKWKEFKKND